MGSGQELLQLEFRVLGKVSEVSGNFQNDIKKKPCGVNRLTPWIRHYRSTLDHIIFVHTADRGPGLIWVPPLRDVHGGVKTLLNHP